MEDFHSVLEDAEMCLKVVGHSLKKKRSNPMGTGLASPGKYVSGNCQLGLLDDCSVPMGTASFVCLTRVGTASFVCLMRVGTASFVCLMIVVCEWKLPALCSV